MQPRPNANNQTSRNTSPNTEQDRATPYTQPPHLPNHIHPSISQHSILPQTLPHALTTPFPKLLRILAPQPSRLHVGRALVVGTAQHADDGEDDSFGGLDRRPALGGGFVPVFVFFRGVQDRLDEESVSAKAREEEEEGEREGGVLTMQTSPEG